MSILFRTYNTETGVDLLKPLLAEDLPATGSMDVWEWVGNGTDNEFVITHGWGNLDIAHEAWYLSDGETVEVDCIRTDEDNVTIRIATPLETDVTIYIMLWSNVSSTPGTGIELPVDASDVEIDASGFTGNLNTSITNLQLLAAAVNSMDLGAEGVTLPGWLYYEGSIEDNYGYQSATINDQIAVFEINDFHILFEYDKNTASSMGSRYKLELCNNYINLDFGLETGGVFFSSEKISGEIESRLILAGEHTFVSHNSDSTSVEHGILLSYVSDNLKAQITNLGNIKMDALKAPSGEKIMLMVDDEGNFEVVQNGTGVLTNDGSGNLSWV